MRTDDFNESEDIEDRRGDEAYDPSIWDRVMDTVDNIGNNLGQVFSPSAETDEGLAAEGGFNDIPRAGIGSQLVGPFRQMIPYAAGGPVSSLKRLSKHPIFPHVRIVHARIPGLVNSNVDMSVITVNSNVPTVINVNGKRIPTAAPLAVRELYTRAGCEVFREAAQKHGHTADPQDIHTCGDKHAGQVAEKQFLVEHYKFTPRDLAAYAKFMRQLGGRGMKRGGPVEAQTSRDAAAMGEREESRRPTHREIEENEAVHPNTPTPDDALPVEDKVKQDDTPWWSRQAELTSQQDEEG